MNRQEMLDCLDDIQQQIDRLRTIIIQGSDHDVEQDIEKPSRTFKNKISRDSTRILKPSREVQLEIALRHYYVWQVRQVAKKIRWMVFQNYSL